MLDAVRLTLLTGRTVLRPAPPKLLDALDALEVEHGEDGRSGFQITFRAGRGDGPEAALDYPLLSGDAIAPGARFVAMLTLGLKPRVLIDGIVTNQQLRRSDDGAVIAVTGEDLTFKMDQEERDDPYPGMGVAAIAALVVARYARFGMVPAVIPPPVLEVPLPIDRVVVQQESDLVFLRRLAAAHDYVFLLKYGPAPGTSQGYFGPSPRLGVPQPALTVDMGPDTNVTEIDFQNDAAQATEVAGRVQDRRTNQQTEVRSAPSRRPPLAAEPARANPDTLRRRRYRARGGTGSVQAAAEATAEADRAADTVTATVGVDGGAYGEVLEARRLVGLRGVGRRYDGLWYVASVTHTVRPGAYAQSAQLVREGTGTTVPVVRP